MKLARVTGLPACRSVKTLSSRLDLVPGRATSSARRQADHCLFKGRAGLSVIFQCVLCYFLDFDATSLRCTPSSSESRQAGPSWQSFRLPVTLTGCKFTGILSLAFAFKPEVAP